MSGTERGMDEARVERIRRALRWILARLESAGVRGQVAGGLAALAHGASRPLHDIDLYVPAGALERLRSELAEHRVHGPERVRTDQWDCYFMEVSYAGEAIELAEAARTRYRAGPEGPWYEADVDFERPAVRSVFGVAAPVMPLDRLLAYKRRLGRPVDRRDVAELEASSG